MPLELRNRTINKEGEMSTDDENAKFPIDDLLITLNRMTDVLDSNHKKGNGHTNINIENFGGLPNEDPKQWLEKFEAWIGFNGWSKNSEKIASAMQLKLEGNALSWFQSVPQMKKNDPGELFKAFTEHFTTVHPTWMLEQQLYDRVMQPGEGLELYILDIEKRCQRLQKSPRETVTAFIRGLPASLRLFVIQKNPSDLREAIQSARLAQESLAAFPTFDSGSTLTKALADQQKAIADLKISVEAIKTSAPVNRIGGELKCQLCDKVGHSAKQCRNFNVREKTDTVRNRRDIECYKCHKRGHIARECRGN